MIQNLQLSRTRAALLAAALAALALIAALAARSLMPDGVHTIPMTLSEGAAVNDQGALLLSDDGDSRETGLISPATLGAAGLALSTALFIALARRRSRPRYADSRGQRPQARKAHAMLRMLQLRRVGLTAVGLAALALLAAAALWSSVASAQTPADDEPTGAAAGEQTPEDDEALTTLQRTHIVAEIPEQYNEPFQLRWGGGSLYQLKQRLATMNCIVDTVWVHQDNQWHGYNQYQVPSTLNAQFIETYSEFIPAGTLYASCYDICEFDYYNAPKNINPRCVSIQTAQENNFYDRFSRPIDSTNTCTRTFDPRVQANVLPSMPLYPDMCIIRQETESVRVGVGTILNPIASLATAGGAPYPYYPAFIGIYSPSVPHENSATTLLNVEVHELCHANQYWHFVENLQPDIIQEYVGLSTGQWVITQAGKTFIDLVGFTKNAQGEWTLPENTPYKNIYGMDDPIELSAELCMLYFVDKMGEQNLYGIYQNDFNVNTYLTPEVIRWLETYIVLPD